MWLTTRNDAPETRLLTGMAYARLNLAATALGLAMHPWSQALQEYDEMADLYVEARNMLGGEDEIVQMLVRVGYADPAPPAARRSVEAIERAVDGHTSGVRYGGVAGAGWDRALAVLLDHRQRAAGEIAETVG